MKNKIESAIEEILTSFDKNWRKSQELKDTPKRVAKAFSEILVGEEDIGSFKTFPTTYSGLVIRVNIPFVSMCPHHLLPYSGHIHFAYIPKRKKIGISKIIRFIQEKAKGVITQEELTDKIIDDFIKILKCRGAMIIVIGYHTCEALRGVKVENVPTITSAIRGGFRSEGLKMETLELIKIALGGV